MTDLTDRGGPIGEVDPKRSFAKEPVAVDWHDTLINQRPVGGRVEVDFKFRLPRSQSTGQQYTCTVAGTTSKKLTALIHWPKPGDATQDVIDGTVTWVAEPISTASLRTTITTATWVVPAPLVAGTESNADLVYQTLVDGGVSGQKYDVKHQIACANDEEHEGVVILPVTD